MLVKVESVIVKTVLKLCGDKQTVLIGEKELNIKVNSALPEKKSITFSQMRDILSQLEVDGYFDVIDSEKKGEKYYCITLHDKAKNIAREEEQTKRKIVFDLKVKLVLACLGAIAAFLITIILQNIIHC